MICIMLPLPRNKHTKLIIFAHNKHNKHCNDFQHLLRCFDCCFFFCPRWFNALLSQTDHGMGSVTASSLWQPLQRAAGGGHERGNTGHTVDSIAVSGSLNRWDRYHIITQFFAFYTTDIYHLYIYIYLYEQRWKPLMYWVVRELMSDVSAKAKMLAAKDLRKSL